MDIKRKGGCIFPEIRVMPPKVVNYNGPFTIEEWEIVMKENPALKEEYDELCKMVMGDELKKEVEDRIRELLGKL